MCIRDRDGSIGKAYGYQMGVKHEYKEGMFDQVDRVLDVYKRQDRCNPGYPVPLYGADQLYLLPDDEDKGFP